MNNTARLAGHRALIAGGSSGIGPAKVENYGDDLLAVIADAAVGS